MGNMFKSILGDCIINNNVKDNEDYKKRIEETLSDLNDKVDGNRTISNNEYKEVRQDIKEVRVETRDGIKDLKEDIKFYYYKK